uniref:Uncharacterized protein n=1 Tax=Oryzias latipes TaxID=8090 RepID=A0A3P9IT96_ORYLA
KMFGSNHFLLCISVLGMCFMFSLGWTLSALTRSCVVIPCTFWDSEQIPMTRGIWAKRDGGIVFHNGRTQVMHHFRDRTKIVGDLSERNCSLEIDDIKPFDNGPFCFHSERGNEKYTFNNSCVFIVMKEITGVPAEVDAGSALTVSCSVTHTCPSHSPEFSWSVPHISSAVSDSLMSGGIWQRTSIINFIVAPGDGVKNLTCTASFWGEKKGVTTATLTVTVCLPGGLGALAPGLPVLHGARAANVVGPVHSAFERGKLRRKTQELFIQIQCPFILQTNN